MSRCSFCEFKQLETYRLDGNSGGFLKKPLKMKKYGTG